MTKLTTNTISSELVYTKTHITTQTNKRIYRNLIIIFKINQCDRNRVSKKQASELVPRG